MDASTGRGHRSVVDGGDPAGEAGQDGDADGDGSTRASRLRWRAGTVVARADAWGRSAAGPGAREVRVRLDRPADRGTTEDRGTAVDPGPAVDLGRTGEADEVEALALPALVGDPRVGDRVLLSVDALARGLGTGGQALVVALPDRLPPDPPAPATGATGHLVKARYLPWQVLVTGVDEPGTPTHARLTDADDLQGLPVVLADLHSAVPAVVAGVRSVARDLRVAYVLSDGASLTAWHSRTVAGLRAAGWLAACLTAGQAMGGDHEAVSVHTALLAARLVVRADVVVVAQGPGNLGTGTRFGFSGVALAEALHATAALGGRPVAALRVSGVDPRPRHRGLSHHSTTVLGRLALAPADVVVPGLPDPLGSEVARQAAPLGGRHRLVHVGTDGLGAVLRDCPVPLSSMGRGPADDPAPFLAAAAAGVHAARLARSW